MSEFLNYVETLPILLEKLLESKNHRINNLTEGKIKEILCESSPVKGIYLMYEGNVPMCVGRSRTLAQKIGTDERSLGKMQASVTKKIMKLETNDFSTMKEARDYLFKNYTVKFIKIDDEILRSLFVIYVATELSTPFNSFMET
ncbi:hypothetical protein [Clostridium tagluense]|uniref:hypothetical protein n=1 Tax=Clostridium tagluense TaxID=360422 RepID=UPI001C6E62FC|nr:hypothetical protein [Clostridium tagluense]MBW9155510.1 hypothetical protein [Clostridium tagluense]WLC66138.1 hypothetical protein KTC93_02530 [Clostridium tagluense]